MKLHFEKLRRLCALALLGISSSICSAAVVHKIDDTTVTGTIESISDGKLTIKTAGPIIVPLDEITQITFKDIPAVVPVVTPQPKVTPTEDDNPQVGNALLHALFGSSHSQAAVDEPATPVTAPPATAPTTQPTAIKPVNLTGVITLTNGDRFHSTITGWVNQKVTVLMPTGADSVLPSSTITEIWLGKPELLGNAKKIALDPGPEDVAFVSKDNDVVAVKGLVQGIAGDSLLFRYNDQDRKINLEKIVGLQLRSNSPAPVTGFHQLIHTDTGDQFSGVLSAVDSDSVVLSTAAQPIKILQSSITSIDFLNGRVTFLTDLKPTRVEQTPYFGRVIPYQINKSLTGGPLVLSDGTCTRGIAVHSRCVLQYDVTGGFGQFKTKLGFQQPDGRQGRVLARVLGDDKPLYENPDARGDQPPIDIDVPLTGVRVLTLEIDFGKDQDVGDRVVWANPRLLRGK